MSSNKKNVENLEAASGGAFADPGQEFFMKNYRNVLSYNIEGKSGEAVDNTKKSIALFDEMLNDNKSYTIPPEKEQKLREELTRILRSNRQT